MRGSLFVSGPLSNFCWPVWWCNCNHDADVKENLTKKNRLPFRASLFVGSAGSSSRRILSSQFVSSGSCTAMVSKSSRAGMYQDEGIWDRTMQWCEFTTLLSLRMTSFPQWKNVRSRFLPFVDSVLVWPDWHSGEIPDSDNAQKQLYCRLTLSTTPTYSILVDRLRNCTQIAKRARKNYIRLTRALWSWTKTRKKIEIYNGRLSCAELVMLLPCVYCKRCNLGPSV